MGNARRIATDDQPCWRQVDTKEADYVNKAVTMVDLAGSQRRNAMQILWHLDQFVEGNAESRKTVMEFFATCQERERTIQAFLVGRDLSVLESSSEMEALQKSMNRRSNKLRRSVALAFTDDLDAEVQMNILRETESLIEDELLTVLDDRVRGINDLLSQAFQSKANRYLLLGGILVLLARTSGATLIYRRSQSLQRSLRQLQKQNTQMEAMEEVSGVGHWEIDIAAQEPWWSPQTKRIHEVPDDFEPEMKTAIDFFAPEYRNEISTIVENGIKTGTDWDVEMEIITAKGRRRWVRAIGRPVMNGDKLVSLVGSFQDITATKRREMELSRALNQKDAV